MGEVKPIRSVLIANRGEIAVRVIRTARRMGIRTVAVHSDADAASPHVRLADEAVAIGPGPVRDSYLRGDRILDAAKASGAEAIHPGYGFLSENAAFAEQVQAAGLIWIGPPPSAIRAMGGKDAAKALMSAAGVPVTPGYLGEDQDDGRLKAEADAIGYPVLIKAVAGGGGKGMRKVWRAEDFLEALASCRREAKNSFGDARVLLETLVKSPRHIEVQVFADSQGGAVHLYERDCSLQRRHQKVIEEAPAPGLDAATRAAVCDAAVRAAKAVGYQGAGTVEFIADASEGLRPDRIWFMEMNTRLQVEHAVTEMITGLDLVEWQFRVAAGEPLPLAQDQIRLDGSAIEARLYAEDPAADFRPSIGPLDHFRLPEGVVRVETGVEQGGEISPFYDPMIAKLIAHAPTREQAAAILAKACRAVEVWPVKTNASFLARALADPDYLAARVDTGFIARHLQTLIGPHKPPPDAWQAAAQALYAASRDASPDPWSRLEGFRANGAPVLEIALQCGDQRRRVTLGRDTASAIHTLVSQGGVVAFLDGQAWRFEQARAVADDGAAAEADGTVRSPIPGLVAATPVKPGEAVVRGQTLVVIEAMKTEHSLAAPFDGVVQAVRVSAGQQVDDGAVVAIVAPMANKGGEG
ncbi:MAG TPA: acetyl/propionyl/methylcrotonyl-CoA carboxylase subunit alpha [Caulobacteraceae bacterium]|jgi:acetyl/propionyl-CoA carboxylase alpha subunit